MYLSIYQYIDIDIYIYMGHIEIIQEFLES